MYKDKYIAAFSEASDPNHFVTVYDTEDEAEQVLWDSYKTVSWRSFGGWHQFGCIPRRCILRKHKDIISDS